MIRARPKRASDQDVVGDRGRASERRVPLQGDERTSLIGLHPSVEMVETEQGLRVQANLPGLDEKDVKLTIDDGVLTLRGLERTETTDEERGQTERSYGRFERSLVLPSAVEEDKAEASFRNCVLSAMLPRAARAPERSRRITISSGTPQTTAH